MSIEIRHATRDDFEWIFKELKKFDEFYPAERSLIGTYDYSLKGIMSLIDEHLFLIAVRGEERLGLIAGYVTHHPYNSDIRLLSEAFWWVSEIHRGTSAGARLLNRFIAWGKGNVDWITCAIESKSPINETALTRKGFKYTEKSFLLEV